MKISAQTAGPGGTNEYFGADCKPRGEKRERINERAWELSYIPSSNDVNASLSVQFSQELR